MKIRRHLALMATAVLVPVVLFSTLTLDAMLAAERQALLQGMQGTARATVRYFIRTVVRAISCTDTTVISHLIQTFR